MNSEQTSCVAHELAQELCSLIDSNLFAVTTCRYADAFDDYWAMQSASLRSDGKTDILIMDGRLPESGDYSGDASAIAWLVAYVLSGKAENGARYLVAEADLPAFFCGITDLLEKAIAPHIVVGLNDATGGGRTDVTGLIGRLKKAGPRDDAARARLKSLLISDFLAPGRRHVVSNLVSPSLLTETLQRAYPNFPSGAKERAVTALRGQLCALGLLDTKQIDSQDAMKELFPAVESAQKRIKAACGCPDAAVPISMHLVDDNPAFQPILASVFGRGCEHYRTLPSQKPVPWETADSVLFMDMRLLPEDEGISIADASGFLYAIKLAHQRPDMPIVFFSSTQQRKLQDAVHEVGETDSIYNIIARFSKPSLSTKGGMNGKSCMNSLKDLADAVVEAAMMVEQSRAMRAIIRDGANVKDNPLYASLYRQRWLEVLVFPAERPAEEPITTADAAYHDMELIREFAMRWATHPQMDEAMQVDITDSQAGWVWALAVVRVWLAAGDPKGLLRFTRRLKAGLLPDYDDTAVVEGIPASHPGTNKDSTHDVLLWATDPQSVPLSVAIKTIILHICPEIV